MIELISFDEGRSGERIMGRWEDAPRAERSTFGNLLKRLAD